MTRSLLRGLLAASAFWTAPAFAADMPVKAPPAAVVASSWTGFYVGATIGARWATNRWTGSDLVPSIAGITPDPNPTRSLDTTAARWGGVAGFNWQLGTIGLVGIEADAGAGRKSASGLAPGTGGAQLGVPFQTRPNGSVTEGWDASLRGRIGVLATPDTLIFGTGGIAWQRIELAASCQIGDFCAFAHNDSVSTTRTGWTAGGGIEHRFWGNWIVRADYRYADFGTFTHTFFTSPLIIGAADDRFTAHVKTRTQTANAALLYKF